MARPAGRTVAEHSARLLALLGVGYHRVHPFLTEYLLPYLRACERNKVVNGGLVLADGIQEGIGGLIRIIAVRDGALPSPCE